MASGDLLRQLFRGYTKCDDTTFRAAAEAIIQEDTSKIRGIYEKHCRKSSKERAWTAHKLSGTLIA
jgi:hypothetical protein